MMVNACRECMFWSSLPRLSAVLPCSPSLLVARTRGGSAHHKLGFDHNFRDVLHASFDSVDQGTRRDLPHLLEGLFYSGEGWIDVGSALNVIETHHRHILRYAQAGFVESADGTNGRNIIVGKQGGKRLLTREQLLGKRVAQIGCGIISFELHNQFWLDANAQILSDFADRVPALVGIDAYG